MDAKDHDDVGERSGGGDPEITRFPIGDCGPALSGTPIGNHIKETAMAELEIQLKRIQDKLQLLLKEHTALQKENALLKDQLSNSEKQTAALHQNMDALKQQVDVLKLSNGEMNEADKKQFEKRINGYLKEIDRAIALLSE